MAIMFFLGDPGPRGTFRSDQYDLHGWRVILLIGAVLLVSAIAVTTLAWLDARRSYPLEERRALLSVEGIWSGVVALALFGTAVGLNIWAWNLQP